MKSMRSALIFIYTGNGKCFLREVVVTKIKKMNGIVFIH